MTDFTDRNAKIVGELKRGRSLRDVGYEFGITRERVRQIAAASGFSPKQNVAKRRTERDQAALREAQDSLLWRTYLANKEVVDRVFGEPLVLGRAPINLVQYRAVGLRSKRPVKFKRPMRPRDTGGKKKYYGFGVSGRSLYLGMTPGGRLYAVKPVACDGRFIYLPMGEIGIKHFKEPFYVELPNSVELRRGDL